MKSVLVTGATGFIGKNLCRELSQQGYHLKIVSRKKHVNFTYPHELLSWDDLDKPSSFESVEAVFHLAGEPLAQKRWSEKQKQEILRSRSEMTKKLVHAVNQHGKKVDVFLSASAIGFYPLSDLEQTEKSPQGSSFLSQVCHQWEKPLQDLKSTRRVVLRLGVVLGRGGGFLKEVEPLFRYGVAGRLGSGSQWMSWVHIKDVTNIFIYLLKNKEHKGAFNITTNCPMTNKDFTAEYYKVIKPIFKLALPAPSFILKMIFKEKSDLLLGSQKILPLRLQQETSFRFQFPVLLEALKDLYPSK